MTPTEFTRLLAFQRAARNAPWSNRVGRRHAKGRAKGVGQVLKNSKVRSDVYDTLEVAKPLQVSFPTNPSAFKKKLVYYKPTAK